jgi:hypothetical protein
VSATEWLEVQATVQFYSPWYLIEAGGVGGELRAVFVPFREAEHALIVVEGARLAAVRERLDGPTGFAWSVRTSIGYELTVDWFRLQVSGGFQHHVLEGLGPTASFSGLYPVLDLLVGGVF